MAPERCGRRFGNGDGSGIEPETRRWKMFVRTFSINFDYRCPFARNANEHVLAGLAAGASWQVSFEAFSLTAVHAEEGDPPVWDNPAKRSELVALAAGVVVRDRMPDRFHAAHRSLFAARHDDGEDLREEKVVRLALERAEVDADAVFTELATEWPYETIRSEHERSVAEHQSFGVPTFVVGDQAVFVRLMTRPGSDGELATKTIERVVDLIAGNPEINEFKHTSIPR